MPPRRIEIRPAAPADAGAWLEMRLALWPEGGREEHAREIERYFAGALHMPLEVLLALTPDGRPLGFAELSIRPYAEGCVTDRIAYLEGWYVAPEARRGGVGRALVEAAEGWAARQGCTEIASDTLLDNDASTAAHAALGFEEVERIRCFRKDVADVPGVRRVPRLVRGRHVIAVPDLEVSARFYGDVLGFEVHEIGEPYWRFFVRDGCVIMAGECRNAILPGALGDHSWFAYFEIEGIDAFHEEIVRRGADVPSPPEDRPWGMRELTVRTADGHRMRFGSPIERE